MCENNINNYPNYSISLKSFHDTNYNIIIDVKMKEGDWNPRAIQITIIFKKDLFNIQSTISYDITRKVKSKISSQYIIFDNNKKE